MSTWPQPHQSDVLGPECESGAADQKKQACVNLLSLSTMSFSGYSGTQPWEAEVAEILSLTRDYPVSSEFPELQTQMLEEPRQVNVQHEPGQVVGGTVQSWGLVSSSNVGIYCSVPAIGFPVEIEALYYQVWFFERNRNSEFYVDLMGNQFKHTKKHAPCRASLMGTCLWASFCPQATYMQMPGYS